MNLTEVLLINGTKMKLCVWARGCLREKAVIATEYKAARFLQKCFFFFYVFVSLLFLTPLNLKGTLQITLRSCRLFYVSRH